MVKSPGSRSHLSNPFGEDPKGPAFGDEPLFLLTTVATSGWADMVRSMRLREWGLLLAWVGATTVGYLVVGDIFHFPGGPGPSLNFEAAAGGAVFGAVTGLLVGMLQWLVLRRRMPKAGRWVWATALGIAITHGIVDGAPDSINLALLTLPGLAVLGGLQARLLHRSVNRVLWMLPYVVVALAYYGGKPDWRLTPVGLLFTLSGAVLLFLALSTGAVLARESLFSSQRTAIAPTGSSGSQ